VKLGVEAQGRPFHPGVTGEGKTGRVNNREPSMMSRDEKPRTVGSSTEVQGHAAAKRQAMAGDPPPSVSAPPSPGYRGHPPRSHLTRAQRDNPVEVRAAMPGKPTVRKAELRGGRRMTQEANAGGRKAAGNRDDATIPPSLVSHNWPDTGIRCPGLERELTWVR
jgi:hypothetical protein